MSAGLPMARRSYPRRSSWSRGSQTLIGDCFAATGMCTPSLLGAPRMSLVIWRMFEQSWNRTEFQTRPTYVPSAASRLADRRIHAYDFDSVRIMRRFPRNQSVKSAAEARKADCSIANWPRTLYRALAAARKLVLYTETSFRNMAGKPARKQRPENGRHFM